MGIGVENSGRGVSEGRRGCAVDDLRIHKTRVPLSAHVDGVIKIISVEKSAQASEDDFACILDV